MITYWILWLFFSVLTALLVPAVAILTSIVPGSDTAALSAIDLFISFIGYVSPLLPMGTIYLHLSIYLAFSAFFSGWFILHFSIRKIWK